MNIVTVKGGLAEVPPGALVVSLEGIASLIGEELQNDQSDFVEGGVDIGRTVGEFLNEVAPVTRDNGEVLRWGIENLWDRGLKYLSTGEIRRTVLCRALLQQPETLFLCDPYEGLDAATRVVLSDYLEKNRAQVLEAAPGVKREVDTETLQRLVGYQTGSAASSLVKMVDVNVGWGEKKVLRHLTWEVVSGEHWLIRGPNGVGKTTLLELITGDNSQAFCNEVYLFGKRRGSGETLWDIRSKLGIVSHRLHVEYRRVGDTPLEAVILSGFHDSIGLYENAGDREKEEALEWLRLARLEKRAREAFKNLSYGEQREALILRGAVKGPPLLILDEPCHGLDAGGRDLVLRLMDTVAARGASTLLHVTHDPTEVRPFEKHVLELKPETSSPEASSAPV